MDEPLYEDIADARVDDLPGLLGERLVFRASDRHWAWMTAHSNQGRVFLRWGFTFPEEDMWSLWLGDGRWFSFNEKPHDWTVGFPDGSGPEWGRVARPQFPLGRDEFTEQFGMPFSEVASPEYVEQMRRRKRRESRDLGVLAVLVLALVGLLGWALGLPFPAA